MSKTITLQRIANGILALDANAALGDLSQAHAFVSTSSIYGGDAQKLLDFINEATAPDPVPTHAEIKMTLADVAQALLPPELAAVLTPPPQAEMPLDAPVA